MPSDVFDLPGLKALLRAVHTREVSVVEVETAVPSPYASSLLFDYVATYMYEGDTPNAERRAAALALDRDLLRELLGQEELRELIDPDALATVEADLQRRSQRTQATTRDTLHDVLRVVGDLTAAEVAERVLASIDSAPLLDELEAERRAVRLRIGGEQRWIAAQDVGLYRDGLGAMPPGGLPEAFLGDVDDPLGHLVARWATTHGPFTSGELRARYGIDLGRRCARPSAPGRSCAASCVPAAASASGATWRCCGGCAARRWRRCARRSRRSTSARWRASIPAGRGSTATPRAAPVSTACAMCCCRCRASR